MGERKNRKLAGKRIMSVFMAFAVMLTSLVLPGTAAKAETTATAVKLYCYVGDQTDKTDTKNWGFNLWEGSNASVTEKGAEDIEISGWGKAIPSLIADAEHEGWGYVGLSGADIAGYQFVYTDGNVLSQNWNTGILALGLTEAYLKDGKWYTEIDCINEVEEPQAPSYKLYFKLPEGTELTDWGVNIWGTGTVSVKEANTDVTITPTGWKDGDFPTLLADAEKAGWGYVTVEGQINGIQFVNAEAQKYDCWEAAIREAGLAEAYYDTVEGKWYKDAACTQPVVEDAGISNPEDTVIKLYYYITDSSADFVDYGVNVWDNVNLTEAGSYMTVTAWNNQKYRSLLDAGKANTISGLDGKWGYVGLDSNAIAGLQFVAADGGDNIWNSEITSQSLTEAYFVPGYGWYKEDTADTEIQAPELHDTMYLVGAGEALGNWTLADAKLMTKNADGSYTLTLAMTPGTYEFTPVQDAPTFAWKYQYKDYENEWSNYSVTLTDERNVTFTVKNPDAATGKAEVSACKNYTVTFQTDDEILSTAVVLEGQAAKAPEAPKKAGFVFTGWDCAFDSITSDLTVRAVWTPEAPKTSTVTFRDGGKVVKTQIVENGKAAEAPSLVKAGYSLSWDKAFDKITADTVVNAVWKPNTYTITYQVNGGKALKTKRKAVVYGQTYGTLASPKRSGYSFAGWYTAKTKGTKLTAKSRVTITKDTTLYAHWKKVARPGKVSKVKAKNTAAKAMKVTFRKVSQAEGYEIRYSLKSNMKGAKKAEAKKTSVTIKKLKKGKTYYVQVKAYRLDSTGKKIYSKAYSAKAKVLIRK